MKKRRKAQLIKNYDGSLTVVNIEGHEEVHTYWFDTGKQYADVEVEVIETKEYRELLTQIGVDAAKAPLDLLKHVRDYILQKGVGGTRIAMPRTKVEGFCGTNTALKIVTEIEWHECTWG